MKNEYDYLNDVKMDFSMYESEMISEKEAKIMKKEMNSGKKRMKKRYIITVCAAVIALTSTVFASGFAGGIIKKISTGYNTFIQMDPKAEYELPEALQNKFFDKDGNPINTMTDENVDKLYDENGNLLDVEQIKNIYNEAIGDDVELVIAEFDGEYDSSVEKSYASVEEAQKDAAFDIKTPDILPDGYTLLRAYSFKNSDGVIEPGSSFYMNMEYVNGDKKIAIMERLLNEETAFEAGTNGSMEEIDINGCKGIIMDNSSIHFETKDGISVEIMGRGNLNRDELIKIAKSIK